MCAKIQDGQLEIQLKKQLISLFHSVHITKPVCIYFFFLKHLRHF